MGTQEGARLERRRRRGGGEPAGGAPEGARESLGAPTKRGGAREGAPGPGRTYRLMVRSRVRGLVCWMYLLPNWLTPRGQPVCERLGGTTDMLASSSTGGEKKRGGQGDFPCAGSGYLRPPQQTPPAINRTAPRGGEGTPEVHPEPLAAGSGEAGACLAKRPWANR